eukprot:30022-Prorocentrum_minimum.AAC.2
MLDLRADAENALAAFDRNGRGRGSDSAGGEGGEGAPQMVPFGTRLSAVTGDIRRHYMRHIKCAAPSPPPLPQPDRTDDTTAG